MSQNPKAAPAGQPETASPQGAAMEAWPDWGGWGARVESIGKWARDDDIDALRVLPLGELLAADALMRLGRNRRPGDKGLGGVLSLALSRDAPAVAAFALGHPGLLASRCASQEEVRELARAAMREAIETRSARCARMIAGSDAQWAWTSALACLPGRKLGSGRRREGSGWWAEGFAALSEAGAQAWGDPGDGSGELARQAVALALSAPPPSLDMAESSVLAGAGIGAAKAMMAKGWPEAELALLRGAVEPGPAQREAWDLAKGLMAARGGAARACSAEALGLEPGFHKSMPGERFSPTFEVGQTVDPAWVCASLARSPSSVGIAREMAAACAGQEASRPRLRAAALGLEHPLAKVWAMWRHSTRAGRPVPDKALDGAERAMRAGLEQWRQAVEGSIHGEWERVGSSVLSRLRSGSVPDAFPGFATEPRVAADSEEMSRPLSPLVFRMRPEFEMGERQFVALARAGAAIGFPLGEALDQMRVGLAREVPAQWIASAEREILQDELGAAPAPAAPRARLRV